MNELETADGLSYHDVRVYVGDAEYAPSSNYALQLTCTKSAGWQLWHIWNKQERLLGGEFNDQAFCIEVAGMVIVGTKPTQIVQPQKLGGWSGVVWVEQ